MKCLPLVRLLGVVLIASVPRVVFHIQQRNAPTFSSPEGGDSLFYDRVARGEPVRRRAYFHSPGYQWLLRAIYRTIGRDLATVRLLQHALGVLSALCVYLLTLRLWGSGWLAFSAGSLFGLLGPPLFYEGQLLPVALLTLLLLVASLALERLISDGRHRFAVAFGLLCGAAALMRPTALVWLPTVLIALAIKRRLSWARGVALALSAAFAIAPATIRNWVVENDFVLITANGGLNFYIGQNPRADGSYNLPEGLWFAPGDPRDDFAGFSTARDALGHTPSSSELSRWWMHKAWDHIASDPVAALERSGRKVYLWLNTGEQPQLYDYRGYRRVAPVLSFLPLAGPVVWGALLALVLVVVRRVFRSPGREPAGPKDPQAAGFFGLCVTVYALAYLPFFVVGRYRAPWLALAAPVAAWAFYSLFRALKVGDWQTRLLLGAVTVACAVATLVPVPLQAPVAQLVAFGRASEKQAAPSSPKTLSGLRLQAARWYRRAIALDPEHWAARVANTRLALLLLDAGQPAGAQRILEAALHHHPRSPKLTRLLGRSHLAQGQPRRATTFLRRALELAPGDIETWLLLARSEERQQHGPAARQACLSARTLALSARERTRIARVCRALTLGPDQK